jgi:phosphoglycerate dehydrogenase-like enzyme
MKAAFFSDGQKGGGDLHIVDRVYANGRRQKISEITELASDIITSDNFEDQLDQVRDVEVIFSTWGMLPLTSEQLDQLPRLKAVFYAAGATQDFRAPFLERGITVCSATTANAIPVAEFALAQILLAGAGYYRNSRECVDRWHMEIANSFRGHGNYDGRVSILGNGTISTYLQEFLAMHTLEVVVVPSRAENRTVSLEEAFATSFAVINLFPDRDDNVGIFNESLFAKMIPNSVFINVGRGRQVNEPDLVRVMKLRPDLTALLDVQHPEPPVDDSELYSLPNVQLSAHIAGSTASEFIRMADYMIEEFQRFERGDPLLYEVQAHAL